MLRCYYLPLLISIRCLKVTLIAMFLEVVTLIQHLHADQYTSIPKIICMTVAISFYHLRSTHQLPCESKLVTTDYIKETQLTA